MRIKTDIRQWNRSIRPLPQYSYLSEDSYGQDYLEFGSGKESLSRFRLSISTKIVSGRRDHARDAGIRRLGRPLIR